MPERRDYEQFYRELDQKKLDFNEALSAFAEKLVPAKVQELIQDVAWDVLKGVTEKTPVDTGKAKASWNLGIETADLSVVDVEGKISGDEALNMVLERADPIVSKIKPFDKVVISNNTEYIGSLERGHSKQAPIGMLGLTLDEIKVNIQSGVYGK